MLEIAKAFLVDNWAIISIFLINEIVAINPKWFSGSIGQLVLNVLRSFLAKPPIAVPAPPPKV